MIGPRALGIGHWVLGIGHRHRALGIGHRVLGIGHWASALGPWASTPGIHGHGLRALGIGDIRHSDVDIEHWALVIWYIKALHNPLILGNGKGNLKAMQTMGIGHWALGIGPRALGLGIDCNGQAAAVTRGALRFVFLVFPRPTARATRIADVQGIAALHVCIPPKSNK